MEGLELEWKHQVRRKEALGLGNEFQVERCSVVGQGNLWGWEEKAMGDCMSDCICRVGGVYLSLQTELYAYLRTYTTVTR